jgi:hypothetical protein
VAGKLPPWPGFSIAGRTISRTPTSATTGLERAISRGRPSQLRQSQALRHPVETGRQNNQLRALQATKGCSPKTIQNGATCALAADRLPSLSVIGMMSRQVSYRRIRASRERPTGLRADAPIAAFCPCLREGAGAVCVDASHLHTLAVARPATHVQRAQVVSGSIAQGEPALFRASSNRPALTTPPRGREGMLRVS